MSSRATTFLLEASSCLLLWPNEIPWSITVTALSSGVLSIISLFTHNNCTAIPQFWVSTTVHGSVTDLTLSTQSRGPSHLSTQLSLLTSSHCHPCTPFLSTRAHRTRILPVPLLFVFFTTVSTESSPLGFAVYFLQPECKPDAGSEPANYASFSSGWARTGTG